MEATGNDIDINLSDATICYDNYGKGAIPIIFVHGFPFDKSTWKPQMESLKNTHRVIAYDIRGFGKSTSGKEEFSIRLFADDLIKFMDGLEINKAIVCGLSMGGYILLNAVYRFPKRFEAIILSDTQCIADPSEIRLKREQTISQIESNGSENFADGFVKTIFYPESFVTKKELVENIKNLILSCSTQTIIGTLKALANRWETCTSLNEISFPTLIICGRDDKVTPLVQSEFMKNAIKNSTLQIINKAGHLSNLEQPAEFNQHLIDFISGLSK